MDLTGKVVVVTGASSGLGRRFAVDLAGAGAVVVGMARREDLLAGLEGELTPVSPKSRAVVCDVSQVDGYVAALHQVESDYGRIDVLVNNAGIGEPRQSSGVAALRSVMETNYFAAAAGSLAVVPAMVERGAGVVVNVSSDSGRAPGPGEPAYSATKAALSAFSESLSMQLDGTGVRVHVLYPGWVPTAMGSGAVSDGMPMPPRTVRRTEAQVSALLLRRLGGDRVDIDAARVARLAPVARALFPRLYRRGVIKAST